MVASQAGVDRSRWDSRLTVDPGRIHPAMATVLTHCSHAPFEVHGESAAEIAGWNGAPDFFGELLANQEFFRRQRIRIGDEWKSLASSSRLYYVMAQMGRLRPELCPEIFRIALASDWLRYNADTVCSMVWTTQHCPVELVSDLERFLRSNNHTITNRAGKALTVHPDGRRVIRRVILEEAQERAKDSSLVGASFGICCLHANGRFDARDFPGVLDALVTRVEYDGGGESFCYPVHKAIAAFGDGAWSPLFAAAQRIALTGEFEMRQTWDLERGISRALAHVGNIARAIELYGTLSERIARVLTRAIGILVDPRQYKEPGYPELDHPARVLGYLNWVAGNYPGETRYRALATARDVVAHSELSTAELLTASGPIRRDLGTGDVTQQAHALGALRSFSRLFEPYGELKGAFELAVDTCLAGVLNLRRNLISCGAMPADPRPAIVFDGERGPKPLAPIAERREVLARFREAIAAAEISRALATARLLATTVADCLEQSLDHEQQAVDAITTSLTVQLTVEE